MSPAGPEGCFTYLLAAGPIFESYLPANQVSTAGLLSGTKSKAKLEGTGC